MFTHNFSPLKAYTEMEFNPDLFKILSNGGISIILFAIWFFTFKQAGKNYDKSQEQSAKIYEQGQLQFKTALEQSQKQFEEALAQNNKNYETIFSIFREDVKYKAMLSEVLTKLEIKLDMRNNVNNRRSSNEQQ